MFPIKPVVDLPHLIASNSSNLTARFGLTERQYINLGSLLSPFGGDREASVAVGIPDGIASVYTVNSQVTSGFQAKSKTAIWGMLK